MRHPKSWAATAVVGLTLMAVSVLMGFLADHHWYLGYETSLLVGVWFWRVQAAGIVLSVLGGIGLLVNATPRAALLMGAALIAAGLLLLVVFGGVSILNVHNWRIVLLFPLLLVFVSGALSGIVAGLRLALLRRRRTSTGNS